MPTPTTPIQIENVVATLLGENTTQPMTLQRIIGHIATNSAELEPTRQAIYKQAEGMQLGGQDLINAMAGMGGAAERIIQAKQEVDLHAEKLVNQRMRQVGVDMNNPANDRLAQLSTKLQEQQDIMYGTQDKIQQLDSTNFADNPLQWLINQFKIESEQEVLQRTGQVVDALRQDLTTMHNLAQEGQQTVLASKIAKSEGELLAAKEFTALTAAKDFAEAKQNAAGKNIQALSAVLGAKSEEHSLMFKAAQLIHDDQERQRDSEKNRLQLELLRFNLSKLKEESADEKALVADMRRFIVQDLGGDPTVTANTPAKTIINNKPLQEAYFARRGITGPQGPYSALNSVEQAAGATSPVLQLPVVGWIKGQTSQAMASMDSKLAMKVGPAAEEAQRQYIDGYILKQLKAELSGDADSSTLLRIAPIGNLRQMEAVKNTQLFKKYLASAPDTTWYSFKQIIGFALKDEKLLKDGAARAQLVSDIQAIALADAAIKAQFYGYDKFGLGEALTSLKAGYRIAPKEVLEAANKERPTSAQLRYLDMTRAGDVQLLINMALDYKAMTGMQRLRGMDLGNELRAKDNTFRQSVGESPVIEGKKDKPNNGPHGTK